MGLLESPQIHNRMERKLKKGSGFLASELIENVENVENRQFMNFAFDFPDPRQSTGSKLMFSQATIAVTMNFEFHLSFF